MHSMVITHIFNTMHALYMYEYEYIIHTLYIYMYKYYTVHAYQADLAW